MSSKYKDELFNKSLQLALHWKLQNMTQEDMINRIVQEKIDFVKNDEFDYFTYDKFNDYLQDSFCSLDFRFQRRKRLLSMLDRLIGNISNEVISEQDIKAGFAVFSATELCSNTPKNLYNFFSELLSRETPRTILLTLVNTIRSGSVKTYSDKMLLNKFYTSLHKVMNLTYGNILLASSSKEDLKQMMDRN